MLRIRNGERIGSSTNVVGKLDICMQKEEIRPLFYTMHKNQLEMNQSLRSETVTLLKAENKEKVS